MWPSGDRYRAGRHPGFTLDTVRAARPEKVVVATRTPNTTASRRGLASRCRCSLQSHPFVVCSLRLKSAARCDLLGGPNEPAPVSGKATTLAGDTRLCATYILCPMNSWRGRPWSALHRIVVPVLMHRSRILLLPLILFLPYLEGRPPSLARRDPDGSPTDWKAGVLLQHPAHCLAASSWTHSCAPCQSSPVTA